jgi:hypothetical protein
LRGDTNQGGGATAAMGSWTHRVVAAGSDATGCGRWSYITYRGKGGKRLTYITVYRVCYQTDPGDTNAWMQKYNIQYEDESAHIININPRKQTLVDLEYFVNDLRHKEQDVAIFIDANQNDRRCCRPQGHDNHLESDGGFNIDRRIDGSLKTFLDNISLVNVLTINMAHRISRQHVNQGQKSLIMYWFLKVYYHTLPQSKC